MKRSRILLPLALLSVVTTTNEAQVFSTVRGRVLDEQGKGIADVKIEMEFKGESRVKIVKNMTTDKKGGYVRSGLTSGKYQVTFVKDGYKTYVMETDVSLGGYSELPEVTMKAGSEAAAAPTPGAPGAPAPEAILPADAEAGKVGETYSKAVEATKAGQLDEAEALYKEVLAKLPDLAGAHYNLGFIYQTKKDWKAAETEFVKVSELQPTRSDAFIALAAIRELDGRADEGIETLLKAAPTFEQDAKFQFALGMTSMNQGRPAEAAEAFKKLQALEPENPEPYFHLGTLAVGASKVPEALAHLEKYVSLTGQKPQNLETAKRLIAALKPKK
jgi:Flp pilus assembly protein TadD